MLERPSADGPYGAKGVGEMTANSPIPAIANAIFDAVGVRIDYAADHAGADPARHRWPERGRRRTDRERTKMLKVMSLMKRKEGMSYADFQQLGRSTSTRRSR